MNQLTAQRKVELFWLHVKCVPVLLCGNCDQEGTEAANYHRQK